MRGDPGFVGAKVEGHTYKSRVSSFASHCIMVLGSKQPRGQDGSLGLVPVMGQTWGDTCPLPIDRIATC